MRPAMAFSPFYSVTAGYSGGLPSGAKCSDAQNAAIAAGCLVTERSLINLLYMQSSLLSRVRGINLMVPFGGVLAFVCGEMSFLHGSSRPVSQTRLGHELLGWEGGLIGRVCEGGSHVACGF